MSLCEQNWLQGQQFIHQNRIPEALEQWNECLARGNAPAKVIYEYSLQLDQVGESVRALQLLEMYSITHSYDARLERLYQWLIEARELPGQVSPLSFLNQNITLLWFLLGLLGIMWLGVFTWKWSPLRNYWNQPKEGSLFDIQPKSSGLRSLTLVLLVSCALLVGFTLGLNIYEETQFESKPKVMLATDLPLYDAEAGPEASRSLTRGQKVTLADLSVKKDLTFYWPYEKLKKVAPDQRRRVKVLLSSGQSGYLWVDQLLLLDKP